MSQSWQTKGGVFQLILQAVMAFNICFHCSYVFCQITIISKAECWRFLVCGSVASQITFTPFVWAPPELAEIFASVSGLQQTMFSKNVLFWTSFCFWCLLCCKMLLAPKETMLHRKKNCHTSSVKHEQHINWDGNIHSRIWVCMCTHTHTETQTERGKRVIHVAVSKKSSLCENHSLRKEKEGI